MQLRILCYNFNMLQRFKILLYSKICAHIFWKLNVKFNFKQIVFLCIEFVLRTVQEMLYCFFYSNKRPSVWVLWLVGTMYWVYWSKSMQMCTVFLMEVCLKSNSNIHFSFFRMSRFSTPTFYLISKEGRIRIVIQSNFSRTESMVMLVCSITHIISLFIKIDYTLCKETFQKI